MKLLQRLFHRCSKNLEYIEGTSHLITGTADRDKIWMNYRCIVCGKLYTSCGNGLYRINSPYEGLIKTRRRNV